MSSCKSVNEADNTHIYEEAAPLLQPYEANERTKFIEDVKSDHLCYSNKEETSPSCLYKLLYYYDFKSLPETFKFEKVVVSDNCNSIDIQYTQEEKMIDIFWFRAIDDPKYDFVEDTRQLFSDYDGDLFEKNNTKLLKIHHPKNEMCKEAYNQYTFVSEKGDNIEISVPYILVEEYGEDVFLEREAIAIE